MKLSVIGLGKLGACSAACFSYKGFDVIGVDINKNFVDAINQGKAPVYEPRLQELISQSKGRLKATQDYEEALKESEVTFLIVPTPSKEDGHFSDKYLQDSLRHLAAALKRLNKKHHIFVITSTVSPGTTENQLIPLIETVSGRKLNKDFSVCYNPEFIALGSVITDFLNPDLILIGESQESAGRELEKIYEKVCDNKPRMARMSLVSAEITKISLNSYVTMKISFANTLANICESIPGADVDDITKALGADKRISPYYLKGGLSFGGPCFPRDNRAFSAFAAHYGIDAVLAKATDKVNHMQVEHLSSKIISYVSHYENKVISILGLAYKPNTPVIEESPAIKLIEDLLKKDMEVIVYDPLAMENVKAHFGDNILYASSVKDCFANTSICIIMSFFDEMKAIDNSYIINEPTVLIDCWRIMDPSLFNKKVIYIPLGRYTRDIK
ncbi:MAG: UDP-glucose/GDP-mannose dehydrogenase family protein [bacterium]|nr:UDP-glucose/GDP-mannose dehydrogenase family protein [bacterium]